MTSPRPAAPPDTGRMPSTRGGSQSNPLASPGGVGALGAPTDPLPSPVLEVRLLGKRGLQAFVDGDTVEAKYVLQLPSGVVVIKNAADTYLPPATGKDIADHAINVEARRLLYFSSKFDQNCDSSNSTIIDSCFIFHQNSIKIVILALFLISQQDFRIHTATHTLYTQWTPCRLCKPHWTIFSMRCPRALT
eukprot:SAG25_NODE_142_length_14075_cov_38.666070_15_plen_191_part_00